MEATGKGLLGQSHCPFYQVNKVPSWFLDSLHCGFLVTHCCLAAVLGSSVTSGNHRMPEAVRGQGSASVALVGRHVVTQGMNI